MSARSLSQYPVHLGLGATAVIQPEMTGEAAWYQGYDERHGADGADGRLVSMHRFTASWDAWEMHPAGHEVVVCTEGSITLIQELPDGSHRRVPLRAGEYAVNEPGVWHTADVDEPANALFITAGEGTEGRPR
jgi:quercetin dioxygenase-like cupin family protein